MSHAGASDADYSIRTLQSKGFLSLQAPGKPPMRVEGPISLMSGTTSGDLNPENLSRCLELALDDSPEQTRRIQAAQRRAWSGGRAKPPDVEVWQDAQRLLEPLDVVAPFAELLTFPTRTTHDRRGNQKLLALVGAHALLHQRQRGRDAEGRVVAVPVDYAAIHALVRADTLGNNPDGLSPRAQAAYELLASRRGTPPSTRREVMAAQGWAYNTAKRALGELVDLELAAVVEPGPPARYALVDPGVLGTAELLDPSALASTLQPDREVS